MTDQRTVPVMADVPPPLRYGGRPMERRCSVHHLAGADRAAVVLATMVPLFAHTLRVTDPESLWSFQRQRDDPDRAVEVWARATGAARQAADAELIAAAQRAGLRWRRVAYEPEVVAFPGLEGVHQAERLFCASSELAVAQFAGAGELAPGLHLPTAARHLAGLAALLPGPTRTAFLVHCWEQWTRGMDPGRRVETYAEATRPAGTIARAIDGARLGTDAEHAWRVYLDQVRAIVVDSSRTDHGPVPYLMFQHATRTHERLGVPPEIAASVAASLRVLPTPASLSTNA